MGRPSFNADPKDIRQLAFIGLSNTEIAAIFGAHRTTIERRFKHEIREGRYDRQDAINQIKIRAELNAALRTSTGKRIFEMGKKEAISQTDPIQNMKTFLKQSMAGNGYHHPEEDDDDDANFYLT